MEQLIQLLLKVTADPRYQEGLTYGKPRPGHAEGTVANHILEISPTLDRIYERRLINEEEYWKLKILVCVHDAFKLEGKRLTGHQVSIRHEHSHPSLARKFLAEFTNDEEILSIAQYHDEGHALWQKWVKKGAYDVERLKDALLYIPNVDLYLIFTIIDGYTSSKTIDRSPRWFVDEVCKLVPSPRAQKVLKLFVL